MTILICKRCEKEINTTSKNSIKRKYHNDCWSKVFYEFLDMENKKKVDNDNATKQSHDVVQE